MFLTNGWCFAQYFVLLNYKTKFNSDMKKKLNGISQSNSKTIEVLFILTEKYEVITDSLFS